MPRGERRVCGAAAAFREENAPELRSIVRGAGVQLFRVTGGRVGPADGTERRIRARCRCSAIAWLRAGRTWSADAVLGLALGGGSTERWALAR
eukprot:6353174-Heterocapsa_arctica.AAC.1